jgi:hypothetical protein
VRQTRPFSIFLFTSFHLASWIVHRYPGDLLLVLVLEEVVGADSLGQGEPAAEELLADEGDVHDGQGVAEELREGVCQLGRDDALHYGLLHSLRCPVQGLAVVGVGEVVQLEVESIQ